MAYSIRRMAAALGVSKSQVDRDAKAGMPLDDVDAARAWRLAHQDLARSVDGRIDRAAPAARPAAPPRPPADEDPDDDPPTTDEDTAVYRTERAKREGIRREREQLALQQERNELVAVQEVARLQFTAQRLTRDRIEMVTAGFDRSHAERLGPGCYRVRAAPSAQVEQGTLSRAQLLELERQFEAQRTEIQREFLQARLALIDPSRAITGTSWSDSEANTAITASGYGKV
jgi:hypothetical protein